MWLFDIRVVTVTYCTGNLVFFVWIVCRLLSLDPLVRVPPIQGLLITFLNDSVPVGIHGSFSKFIVHTLCNEKPSYKQIIGASLQYILAIIIPFNKAMLSAGRGGFVLQLVVA